MKQGAAAVKQRHGLKLVGVVLAMFGFGFALGPLYDAVCRVTGINGKTANEAEVLASAPVVDTSREVKVLFVTTVNGGKPWKFEAEQAQVSVHPGELKTVSFYAENTQAQASVAQAVPNVAPWDAARHLKKTECFCFNNQTFQAGEGKHMPVRFMIDPDLPKDVDTVTLSYTFFDVTEAAAKSATDQQNKS